MSKTIIATIEVDYDDMKEFMEENCGDFTDDDHIWSTLSTIVGELPVSIDVNDVDIIED